MRRWWTVFWAVAAWVTPAGALAVEPEAGVAWTVEAGRLIEEASPVELERALATRPSEALRALAVLGRALDQAEEPLLSRIQAHAAAAVRERTRALARRGPPWSDDEIETVLVMMLLDPPRFAESESYRERVIPILEGSVDADAPAELEARLLTTLDRLRNFPFRFAERVQLAWGALRRSSQPLRVPFEASELRPPEFDTPIEATLFSFPSAYIRPAHAERLLDALNERAPERRLLVLADGPVLRRLQALARELPLDLLPTWGRSYSPWVRDVMSFRHDAAGRVVVVLRPDTQLAREQDAHMGQVLLQQLPDDLFARWRLVWAASTIPFHNGQILETDGVAWVSLHGLEAHIRRLTAGRLRPPGPDASADAAAAYLGAAAAGAESLSRLLAQPVRFVHETDPAGDPKPLYSELAGGAGFDLDSLLTLLPAREGELTALVADLGAGATLVAGLSAAELDHFALAYGLRLRGEALRGALLAAQTDARSRALDGFLGRVAAHLAGSAQRVERLPLLRVPVELLETPFSHQDFLVSWNNVSLETFDGRRTAEGFGTEIERADAAAREVYARAGYRLELLPPLIDSIVRNGGYRCASNHLRRIAAG